MFFHACKSIEIEKVQKTSTEFLFEDIVKPHKTCFEYVLKQTHSSVLIMCFSHVKATYGATYQRNLEDDMLARIYVLL